MGKEVEMKDADDKSKMVEDSKPEAETSSPQLTVAEQLAANVKLIEKAVKQKETGVLFSKLLRQTQALRRRLTSHDVQAFVRSVLPQTHAAHSIILDHLKQTESMDVDASNGTPAPTAAPSSDPLPEVEIYAYLLAIILFVDAKFWAEARTISAAASDRLAKLNRRTLDILGARIYFYLSWAAEQSDALGEVRSTLLGLHRAAVLRHDEPGQEMLLNLLLRNYLAFNLYDQAEALRAKAQRDTFRSPAQHCRLLYYQGRIRAVQLEYSDAKDALTQASRKAPASARGFRIAVAKWLTVVRLLLGEVPPRSELAAPELRAGLKPYFHLADAVRSGDLAQFATVATQNAQAFAADGTRHLVARLRSNVIRAGLRRIAAAYSRISLADVAVKLGLASMEDAQFVVAKAIRDGGVAATLDYTTGVMSTARAADVYATDEPQAAFHARIAFCMDIHTEAQKAMRYDPRPQQEWDDANALRERQDQELQAALEDDEMDF